MQLKSINSMATTAATTMPTAKSAIVKILRRSGSIPRLPILTNKTVDPTIKHFSKTAKFFTRVISGKAARPTVPVRNGLKIAKLIVKMLREKMEVSQRYGVVSFCSKVTKS